MLCRIEKSHVDQIRRILTLLCFSRRPLLLVEFADAYAIDPQSGHLDLDRRLLDIADIEKSYPGLIRIIHARENVDEENLDGSAICIARSSLQKYLVSDQIRESEAVHFSLQGEAARKTMAQICVAYLLQFKQHADKVDQGMVEGFPLAHYAAKYWYYHYQQTEHVDPYLSRQILELFQDQEVFDSWASLHDIDRLWESKSSCQPNPAGPPSPVYCASFLGLDWVLEHLLKEAEGNDFHDVNSVHGYGGRLGNALQAAAWQGHEDNIQILLDRRVDVNISGNMCGMLMLKHTSDGTTCGGWCGNALQAASRNGHQGVAQILLDRGADVNSVGGEYETALHAASAHGHVTVVQMLLDWGADTNAHDEVFGDPLQVACLRSHKEVVQMLMSRGAPLKDEGGQDGNALEAASRTGSEEMVQLLLDNGVDVNAYSGGYCNALSNAAIRGHQRIVEILLDHGADPNAGPFRILGSPLIWAAHGGNKKVVQMLLSRGADVAVPGSSRGNALQAATMKGNEGVVRLLLEHGADANARSGDNNTTALQVASRRGYNGVVLALLDSGANVNAPGGQFGTAIEAALKQGHTEIVQILRTAGSKS